MKRLRACFVFAMTAWFAVRMFQMAHEGFFGPRSPRSDTLQPRFEVHRLSATEANLASVDRQPVSPDPRPYSHSRFIAARNRFGQAVGWKLFPGALMFHACLWEGSTERDLGTLGGQASYAHGINDAGEIVGDSVTAEGAHRAFFWKAGKMTDLGTLGGALSYAYGINDLGQVVGDADTETGTSHAFLYANGQMHDLGTLGGAESAARGINNQGEIVGYSDTNPPDGLHAFLYDNGVMTDLHQLLTRRSGWRLIEAWRISEDGQIFGQGELDRQVCSFRLTPCR